MMFQIAENLPKYFLFISSYIRLRLLFRLFSRFLRDCFNNTILKLFWNLFFL